MLTPQEFSEAYENFYPRTVHFLLSRGVGPDVAEEVAQAAWVRGWERQSQLHSDSALLPWVNSIALNSLRAHFRQQTKAPQLSGEIKDALLADDAITLEERRDLQNALDRCTPSERRLLWAYWGEGFTSVEIASQMEIKPVSVRVRVGRIVKTLDQAPRRDRNPNHL